MKSSSALSESAVNGSDSRFDRQLAKILEHATTLFAEKGYEGASMRDLSRLSGMSLAGLYYYFNSKEKLLYLIQRHLFLSAIDLARERLKEENDPEERIRVFIRCHLEYFLAKPDAMKVLSHEDDVLKNSYGVELASIKREYYRICVGLVDEFAQAKGLRSVGPSAGAAGGISTRTAVMGLFGMMNWLYTWYKPRVDPDAKVLAREISDIFLQGIHGEISAAKSNRKPVERSRPATKKRPLGNRATKKHT